jgi:hypothetical protein
MQKALRFHQPSALGLVFVITLAVLVLASVLLVAVLIGIAIQDEPLDGGQVSVTHCRESARRPG